MEKKDLTPQEISKRLERVEMATTTSLTTSYAGKAAGMYISAAMKESDTLGKKLVSINENIKYKWIVKLGGALGAIKDATCDFDPQGSVVITERVLEPEAFQQNILICKDDFRSDWEAETMGMSAFDKAPVPFQKWLIAKMLEELAASIETNIWQGNTATNGQFTGFKLKFTADGTVIDVDNTGVAPTAANVVSVFLAPTLAATPKTVRAKSDFVMRVAPDIFYAYIDSLGGYGAAGLGAAGYESRGGMWYRTGTPIYYGGVLIEMASGMVAGEIVAARTSNLWFGTGVMNDTNVVKVIDTSEILGDQNVRYISRFTAGVQYGIGAEVVYLWNVTP